MKTQNIMKSLLIAILLAGTMQASAVEYQTKYKGTMYNVQSATSISATAPVAPFQSTSAYASEKWMEESATPMLNSDGSVDGSAYMGGRNNAPTGPRRDPGNPFSGNNTPDEGNVPPGDAALPLMLLAIAYCGGRFLRRRKEA